MVHDLPKPENLRKVFPARYLEQPVTVKKAGTGALTIVRRIVGAAAVIGSVAVAASQGGGVGA